jgi:hypothetical protein
MTLSSLASDDDGKELRYVSDLLNSRSNQLPNHASRATYAHDIQDLGQLIIRTGHLVAKRCDQYILKVTNGNSAAAQCADVIERSPCPKGRLLHYFPANADADDGQQWCGWHNDHGSLTGLCSAMFISADGNEVANPDPTAGLYIRDRSDEVVKVSEAGLM